MTIWSRLSRNKFSRVTFNPESSFSMSRAGMFSGAFVLIGITTLIIAKAAVLVADIEPENGTRSSQILFNTDAAASNGSYAQFGSGVAPSGLLYPKSTSGRKMLDQNGNVYLMRTFSSWGMASNLSDAEITTALEGLKAQKFNAVSVWIGGGHDIGSGWHKWTNKAGQNFWTGTPWNSSLGPAWSSMDRVVNEAERLGMVVNMSLDSSYGESGSNVAWELSNNTAMYNAGVAVANRYSNKNNLVWHVMFDNGEWGGSSIGQRVDAFFHGVNDTEGAGRRPVRWSEPNQGNSSYGQLINTSPHFSYFNLTMNGWYKYTSNSTEVAENSFVETTQYPTGDVEPPYDGNTHYGGNYGQQLRERSYATFLEGGMYINYGHEDWWTFGAQSLGHESGIDNWQEVITDPHTVQQQYIWTLIDAYMARTDWVPENGTFLKTGTGSGDTKAAAGKSAASAIAYFPNSRTISVDTTVVTSASNVRLRWYDPTSGAYTLIAASEAKNAARSVSYPANHGDGTADWVLVVDGV